MYKATRILINARQPFSNYVIELVGVRNVGGGRANDCFGNATDALSSFPGSTVTSGWLVGKFDPITNSTEITQHYWNVNANGQYFDTTPGVASHYEYVCDCEIADYAQQHLDNVNNCVSSSLLLKDGEFHAVNKTPQGPSFEPIASLSTSNLFAYAKK